MLCEDFENQLSDYLEGALDAETHRAFSEHALRCPVCHQTLGEVKNTLHACSVASVPPPTRELEARILQRTAPQTAMTCAEFEESLTDYLDGFLPAPFYHRWERHAALCDRCTELPGEVVRSIGACYTYKAEEAPLPIGLEDRILQATIGTLKPQEVRAPLSARLASRLRLWLDPIVSPQLATVATMLLVAVFVLTNAVSADGSISGLYSAGLRLAEQTQGLKGLVGGEDKNSQNNSTQRQGSGEQKQQPKKEGEKKADPEDKR